MPGYWAVPRAARLRVGARALGAARRRTTSGSRAAGEPGSRRVRLGRRQFLAGTLALGATSLTAPLTRRAGAQPKFASVAVHAGRRLRLSAAHAASCCGPGWRPRRCIPGGGMSPDVVVVDWEVASDERMRQIVRRGTAAATPAWAHSVHVEVDGLEPGRWYWYRFRAGGEVSPIGRTRTAPAVNAPLERLRFAFASCQQYEQGYYGAYHRMAGRRPRPGRLPRRLHLRIVVGPRPRAHARRAGAVHARGLSHPPRALQDRPRSAGRARSVPVDRHVGRPRGLQRLRGRPLRAGAPARVVPACAAPAPTRRTSSTCRCGTHMVPLGRTCASTIRSRSATSIQLPHARRPPVPLAPALRESRARRLDRRRGVRRAARSAAHAARRGAGAAGSRRASTARAPAGT